MGAVERREALGGGAGIKIARRIEPEMVMEEELMCVFEGVGCRMCLNRAWTSGQCSKPRQWKQAL